jgi:hypothetical protein
VLGQCLDSAEFYGRKPRRLGFSHLPRPRGIEQLLWNVFYAVRLNIPVDINSKIPPECVNELSRIAAENYDGVPG